jgi:hypothetical protein
MFVVEGSILVLTTDDIDVDQRLQNVVGFLSNTKYFKQISHSLDFIKPFSTR